MIRATRRVPRDEVRSIADLFRDRAAAFDLAGRMLLLSFNEAWPMVRLWVSLPEDGLLGPWCGFTVCSRATLPLAPAWSRATSPAFGVCSKMPEHRRVRRIERMRR